MSKYEGMAKAHTFKELADQFLVSNEIQLLGGMNFIMSAKDKSWHQDYCYQCRRNLSELNTNVAMVGLANHEAVYCCAPCCDLTEKVNIRRIELAKAMKKQ